MIDKIEVQSRILGRAIRATVLRTPEGIQILVAGGDRPHIGAVCVMDPLGNMTSHCFPGHRDDAVAEKWAAEIYKKAHAAVAVSAGIHYDRISHEQIRLILNTTDALLHTVLERI